MAYCESQRELLARDELTAAGVVAFVPYERKKLRTHRPYGRSVVEWVSSPIFPRYLFALVLDGWTGVEETAQRLLHTRGIMHTLNIGSRPLLAADRVVDTLRALGAEDGQVGPGVDLTTVSTQTRMRLGRAVNVGMDFRFKDGGVLGGFIGKVSSLAGLDKSGTLKAWVTMLGGLVEVELRHSDIGSLVAIAA